MLTKEAETFTDRSSQQVYLDDLFYGFGNIMWGASRGVDFVDFVFCNPVENCYTALWSVSSVTLSALSVWLYQPVLSLFISSVPM